MRNQLQGLVVRMTENRSTLPLRFPTVVADPPWPYPSPGGNLVARPEHRPNSYGTGAPDSRARYGAMTIEDIAGLAPPVADNAHLYLWTTNAFMVEAHEIAKAWGFRPVTIGTWVKTKPDGTPSMKTGYYFRGATEHFIFGVRGSLRLETKTAHPTAFMWPRLPHSVKPDQFYDLVESCSPWPWLELFARRERIGWSVWGDEVDSDLEMPRRDDGSGSPEENGTLKPSAAPSVGTDIPREVLNA